MAIKKEKKGKLALVPKQKRAVVGQRPYELWSDMDQLFDSFRSSVDDLFWGPQTNLISPSDYRTPLMDIVDLGDKYEMHVEIPGVKKEDINIEVSPKMVEISADHEETSGDKGKNWLRQERSTTNFYRRLELPEGLKTGKIEAEFKNGLLILSLPKASQQPKLETTKIKVK